MEVLKLEYRRTIKLLRKSHDELQRQEKDLRNNGYEQEANTIVQEVKLINSMLRDCQYIIEWIQSGRDPAAYRGVDAPYTTTKWTPELMATLEKGLYDAYNAMEKEEPCNLDQERINDALCTLTERERDVFVLREAEQYKFVQIAELMGLSESTIKTQYSRAKKKVEERLVSSLFLVC